MIHACTFSILSSPYIPHSLYERSSPSLSFCLSFSPRRPRGCHHYFLASRTSLLTPPLCCCPDAKTNESVVFTMVQLHKDAATSSDSPADLQLHTLRNSVASSALARSFPPQGGNTLQNDGSGSTQTEEVSQAHGFSRPSLRKDTDLHFGTCSKEEEKNPNPFTD